MSLNVTTLKTTFNKKSWRYRQVGGGGGGVPSPFTQAWSNLYHNKPELESWVVLPHPTLLQLHRIPEQRPFFQLLTQTQTKMTFIFCSNVAKTAAGREVIGRRWIEDWYHRSLKTEREPDRDKAKHHIEELICSHKELADCNSCKNWLHS